MKDQLESVRHYIEGLIVIYPWRAVAVAALVGVIVSSVITGNVVNEFAKLE